MKLFYNNWQSFSTIVALALCIPGSFSLKEENGQEFVELWNCCSTNEQCKTVENWIQFAFNYKNINFSLKKRHFQCEGKKRLIHVDLAKAKLNETLNEWNIPSLDEFGSQIDVVFLENGNGTVQIGEFSTLYQPRNSYCVRKVNATMATFEMCCSDEYPCIRKCCYQMEELQYDSKTRDIQCIETDKKWRPPANEQRHLSKKRSEMEYVAGWMNCEGQREPIITPHLKLKNGNIEYFDPTAGKWERNVEFADYCTDRLSERSSVTQTLCPTENYILLLCPSKNEADEEAHSNASFHSVGTRSILYTMCFCIAMLFLLATAVVKFLLWEKQNIHSWVLLCYVLCLFLLYLCLSIAYIRTYILKEVHSGLCMLIGVMTHFFAFCAFCWLSVINFDLWWTFRVLQPVNERKLDIKRFLSYSAFAFLLPLVITAVSVGLHFSKNDEENTFECASNKTVSHENTILQYPVYEVKSCFLTKKALFAYLYGPLGVLLLLNLLFYITTTFRMFTLYKTSRRASETSSKKQKQSLFLKLFVVAGLTWSFEVLYGLFDGTKSEWYWFLLDMANIFQAIAIFVIFVCKRETVRSLEQKYPRLRGLFDPCIRFSRSPNFTDRSTEGSTKISRTELSKNGVSESYSKQENIELS